MFSFPFQVVYWKHCKYAFWFSFSVQLSEYFDLAICIDGCLGTVHYLSVRVGLERGGGHVKADTVNRMWLIETLTIL